MKYTYGQRFTFGDMDYVKGIDEIAQRLNLASYGAFIRDLIPDSTPSSNFALVYGPSTLQWDSYGGTSYAAVVDEEGNAASMSSSINTYFGSLAMSTSSDIIWNNHMGDFSIQAFAHFYNFKPSPANRLEPGKRPQSSIAYDRTTGDVRLVIGASGGVKIISATAQTAVRVLSLKQTLKNAVDAPRLHNQLCPLVTDYESGFSPGLLKRLSMQFHQKMKPNVSSFGSVVCAIHRTED